MSPQPRATIHGATPFMLGKLRQVLIDRPRCKDFITWPPQNGARVDILQPRLPSRPLHSYVIRHAGRGRGLFSLVSGAICHLHLARHYNLTPVVDLEESACEYKDSLFEQNDPWQRRNVWNYYFKPVSEISVDDAYHAEMVLASTDTFPPGYPRMISYVRELREIASEMIKPADDLEAILTEMQTEMFGTKNILGVHYRGFEQQRVPRHPLSPTFTQITTAIDLGLDQHDFDNIFLVTEDQDNLDRLKSRYGKRLLSLPHLRTRKPVNSYKINPRPMHKYLLGKEVLIDTFLLSRCQGLVGSTSNVTEVARSLNNGRYLMDYLIENGINVHNKSLARHLWKIKNNIPPSFGGFSEKAIIPFPDPV